MILTTMAPRMISHSQNVKRSFSSLGFCIMKLLKLEGSRWLFRQNGGCDENLIDQVAADERTSQGTADDVNANCIHRDRRLNCGNGCVWQDSLGISFGVWCIRRVLDLSLAETRPELWGKYTSVLNRLQGILDPAFAKPRKPVTRVLMPSESMSGCEAHVWHRHHCGCHLGGDQRCGASRFWPQGSKRHCGRRRCFP